MTQIDYITVSNSISEYDMDKAFRMFPNPLAEGSLNFVSALMPLEGITLTDLSGRVIKRFDDIGSKEFSIPSFHISKGIYLLQARLENGSLINRKLVIR
jgi:hypothetical protein